jgi:uncharacterized membrane protein YfcA
MLGSIGIFVFRIVFGVLLIVVGILTARKLHKDRKDEDKRGFRAHINVFFGAYLFIIIGIYVLIKGF